MLIPAERQAEEDVIIVSISAGRRVPTFETQRQRKNGSIVDVEVTVSPVLDGEGRVVAASKIARDIVAQKAVLDRLESSESRLRMLADNMAQLAWIADKDGNLIWLNKQWYDYTGLSVDEMANGNWRDLVHLPEHRERILDRFYGAIAAGQDWEDTFPLVGANGQVRWFLSRAKPIRDENGIIHRWFGTNTDVTDMRDAEQRIELLLQEVNHRSKNMLAIIQSLARRTDVARPDFLERLEQRIRSLAANQDVLVRRSWSAVPVLEMIEAQLAPLGATRLQVACDGPEVRLSPGAAEALAMAVHEMCTNAEKYGALSVPTGRVDINWSINGIGGDAKFEMDWRESGGPSVVPPSKPGFGTRIIVDVPRVKLNASVEANYNAAGFGWHLECPATHIG